MSDSDSNMSEHVNEFDELIEQFEKIQKIHEDALRILDRVKQQLKGGERVPGLEESLKKVGEMACQNVKEKKKSTLGKMLKEVVQAL